MDAAGDAAGRGHQVGDRDLAAGRGVQGGDRPHAVGVERLERERLARLEPRERGGLEPGRERERRAAARSSRSARRTSTGARSASSSTSSVGRRAARVRAIAASATSGGPDPDA